MTLNRKVREAEERANQIHQQVYGNTEQTPGEQQVNQEQQQSEPTAQVEEQKPAAQPEDVWEQKYRVLQGKYSAEVPRMAEEIRELKAMIEELKAQPAPAPQAAQLDLKSMTPEAVVEQFGEDFAAAVGAIAARIAEQQGNKFREEFAPKVQAVAERTAKTIRAEFIRDLTALVPDWKAIDVEDGFTAFLDEFDPMTGRTRRHFFNEADAANNAERIAQFFTAYKGKKPVADPAPAVESRMSIESQIAPSASAASNSPTAKKFWTQAEIRRFYQDVRRGMYSVEEGRRIESDILAAAQEGRMAA